MEERGRGVSVSVMCCMRLNQPFVALKMRVGLQGRNGGGPPEGENQNIFPRASEKEVSLASILIFSFCNLIFNHSDPFQNFDLRNHKIIDLCYFKPLFVVICYSSNRKLLQLSKSSVYLDKKSVFFVYVFCSFVISSLKSPGVGQGLG